MSRMSLWGPCSNCDSVDSDPPIVAARRQCQTIIEFNLPEPEQLPEPGGSLGGAVRLAKTNEPLVGATVIVESQFLTRDDSKKLAIIEESGQFFVPRLPAGVYTVTFVSSAPDLVQRNVAVASGRLTRLNQCIDVPRGEAHCMCGPILHSCPCSD
jgi:hypothetical protein